MDQIHKLIVQLQNKCNDCIDNKSALSARALQQSVQKLEDEAQVGKNPRSIEEQIKSVIQRLEDTEHDGAMSSGHVNELVNQCEHLREQIRKLQ